MEQPYVIGIDIGGQTAKSGVVNARGEVLAQTIMVSNKHTDAESFVDALASTIKKLIADADIEGQVQDAPNLSWAHEKDVPFAKMLSEAMGGLAVSLTNDANAAAVGEMTYGAAKGLKHFIMITLGTGVGSGIVIDGQVLYGHDGFAGELGHTCAVRGGRLCGCGKQGCLEAYCSAIGVARTAVEWLDQHPDEPSLLRLRENITSKDVYEAAKAGDQAAKEVFDYTGTLLGRSFADFIAFSAPEAIVLFGGLARAKEFLYDPIFAAMNDNVLPLWKNKVKLLFSSLSESDAAILGASALAWNL